MNLGSRMQGLTHLPINVVLRTDIQYLPTCVLVLCCLLVFVRRRGLVLKWLRCGGCCEGTLRATRRLSLQPWRDCMRPTLEG